MKILDHRFSSGKPPFASPGGNRVFRHGFFYDEATLLFGEVQDRTGNQPQIIPKGFRDCDLALFGKHGIHTLKVSFPTDMSRFAGYSSLIDENNQGRTPAALVYPQIIVRLKFSASGAAGRERSSD